MKVEIEISEENISRLVEEMIAKQFINERGTEYREARYGIRDGVDKAVKNYIYSEKENIIDKVVDRASREIVKKGLPKLLEGIGKNI